MKGQIKSWMTWILVRIQIVTASLDPQVLQWPGGSLIAPFLWLYGTPRLLWLIGTGDAAPIAG
jgi:hypothetical protein